VGDLVYRIGDRLYVNLTNRCTNDCTFCIRRTGPGVAGASLWLLLRAGALAKIARHVKDRSSTPVRVDTNGQANLFLGRNVLPELVGLVDTFSISLNAPDEPTYRRLSRPAAGERAYPAVLEFAREAVRLFPCVVLTVVKVPGVDIEASRKVAEDMGARFRVRDYTEAERLGDMPDENRTEKDDNT